MKTSTPAANKGLAYGRHTGKYLYRVRQTYVADHVVPLVKGRRHAAAKLDIVLRALALLPEHAGDREPGTVLDIWYDELHDLVRDPYHFSNGDPRDVDLDDPKIIEKKRTWTREQLVALEERNLVQRIHRDGRTPRIVVRRDDGTGEPLDDPGLAAKHNAPGSAYLTIPGAAIADERFRAWNAACLAGFLCAMTAESLDQHKPNEPGTGTWFRTVEWFRGAHRPEDRTTYQFATRTIQDGLQQLERHRQLTHEKRTRHRQHRFDHPRKIYTNHFANEAAVVIPFPLLSA